MEIERTKFALESVKDFLSEHGRNPLIENFCVQYLIVCLYSEMEEALSALIRIRLSGIGDERVAKFIASTNDAMIRRVKKSEINDVLKKFGCEELVDGHIDGVNLQPYFDAISNRHLVTHGEGCSMTLEEFERAIPCANLLLRTVEDAIAA